METGRRGGDAEWAGPHTHVLCLKIGKNISAAGVPRKEWGDPTPPQVPGWGSRAGHRSPLNLKEEKRKCGAYLEDTVRISFFNLGPIGFFRRGGLEAAPRSTGSGNGRQLHLAEAQIRKTSPGRYTPLWVSPGLIGSLPVAVTSRGSKNIHVRSTCRLQKILTKHLTNCDLELHGNWFREEPRPASQGERVEWISRHLTPRAAGPFGGGWRL